jgi:hypothetical protein
MGNENWSGHRYWEPTEAASVSDGTKALSASTTPTSTPKFASTSARDSAAATYLAQPDVSTLEGLRCYITNRKAECFHDGTGWIWVPQFRVLSSATRASAAESHGDTLIAIISAGPFDLPAGDRWVQVKARSICTQLASGEARPQGSITGTGLGTNQAVDSCTTTFNGDSGVITIDSLPFVTSGTISYAYAGKDGHATIAHAVRFTDSYLHIADLGPA